MMRYPFWNICLFRFKNSRILTISSSCGRHLKPIAGVPAVETENRAGMVLQNDFGQNNSWRRCLENHFVRNCFVESIYREVMK